MVSDLNIFVWKGSVIAKKKQFFGSFYLQNKVETTLPDELETSGRQAIANLCIFLDVFDFFLIQMFFFRFSINLGFWVFLVHLETTLPVGLETSLGMGMLTDSMVFSPHVRCQVSGVRCQYHFFYFIFLQSFRASRSRVCYQRGLQLAATTTLQVTHQLTCP